MPLARALYPDPLRRMRPLSPACVLNYQHEVSPQTVYIIYRQSYMKCRGLRQSMTSKTPSLVETVISQYLITLVVNNLLYALAQFLIAQFLIALLRNSTN
jgi:hypothetical protein